MGKVSLAVLCQFENTGCPGGAEIHSTYAARKKPFWIPGRPGITAGPIQAGMRWMMLQARLGQLSVRRRDPALETENKTVNCIVLKPL